MHRELQSRMKQGAILALALGLGGCTQLTKHSNTLVFGTNTLVGVKVGTDASQKPTVDLGYNRQEVALVPILANTGVSANGELAPCPAAVSVPSGGTATAEVDDCHFRATHNGKDKDSYSTLASFGGRFTGNAGSDGANGGTVVLAQYFATGIAAQQLALSGGANVVQAGGDTEAKAKAAEAAAKAYSMEFAAQSGLLEEVRAREDAAREEALPLIAAAAGSVLDDYGTAMRANGFLTTALAGNDAAKRTTLSDNFYLQDETKQDAENLEALLKNLKNLTP